MFKAKIGNVIKKKLIHFSSTVVKLPNVNQKCLHFTLILFDVPHRNFLFGTSFDKL